MAVANDEPVLIVTPFPLEADSRAARLAAFLEANGAPTVVHSSSVRRDRSASLALLEAVTSRLRSHLKAVRLLMAARNRQAIVAVNCELTVLAAIVSRLAPRPRPKLVADIYDHHGFIVRGWLPKRAFDLLEALAVRLADHVIIPIPARLDQYGPQSRTRIQAKGVFISNRGFAAPPPRAPAGDADAGPHRPRGDGISIAYLGTIDEGRGLEPLVIAARNAPNITRLAIHGDGSFLPRLRQLAGGSGRILFGGPFAHDQVAALAREADLLWAAYDPAVPNNRFCDPNKFREHVDLDRPLLTNPGHPLAQDIEAAGSGYLVTLDAEALTRALASLDPDDVAARRPSRLPAARARLEAAIDGNRREGQRLLDALGLAEARQ